MEDAQQSIKDVWRRTTGQSVQDPTTQYILESVAVELETSGVPTSLESCRQRFEELVCTADGVEAEDGRDFCEALFSALQENEKGEDDEDGLLPGECEICERHMPLTRHHLIPRTMHPRLRKRGYDRALLSQTSKICRVCHTAVHRFYTEKQLAMEFNTIEKLMQVPNFGLNTVDFVLFRAKILPDMQSGPTHYQCALHASSSNGPVPPYTSAVSAFMSRIIWKSRKWETLTSGMCMSIA